MTEPPAYGTVQGIYHLDALHLAGARANRASDRRRSQRPATALARERAKMSSVTPTTNTMALPLG